MGKILVGVGTVNWAVEPPLRPPGNSHPDRSAIILVSQLSLPLFAPLPFPANNCMIHCSFSAVMMGYGAGYVEGLLVNRCVVLRKVGGRLKQDLYKDF